MGSLPLLGAGPSAPGAAAPLDYPARWGLVAHWAHEEASGDHLDSHTGGYTLTNTGAVPGTTAKVGNGAAFTAAATQRLAIADNAALSMGDVDMWLATWVSLSSKGVDRHIVSKWNSNPNLEYLLYYNNATDRFAFGVSPDGAAVVTASASTFGSPSLDTSYFLMAYYDTVANQSGISVNGGAFNTAAPATGPSNGASPFTIGSRSNLTATNTWAGWIDETSVGKSPALGIAALATEIRDHLHASGAGRAWAAW